MDILVSAGNSYSMSSLLISNAKLTFCLITIQLYIQMYIFLNDTAS